MQNHSTESMVGSTRSDSTTNRTVKKWFNN